MHISDKDMAINNLLRPDILSVCKRINKMEKKTIALILVIIALAITAMYFCRSNTKNQPIEVSSQTSRVRVPSIMELSAAKHKDTVKYSEDGYALRTITVEAYIYADCADESCRPSIMEADGPHFTLGVDNNINDSDVGSTFDCMLRRDDSGFTSGITMGKCSQR